MANSYKYSYMPTDECRLHVKFDAYGIESDITNIHFRNQYERIFVLIDRNKLIWGNVIGSVMWFVIGRLTG